MLVPPILFFATTVTALPFQNATTPEKVGWTPAPRVRGTFDLLLSCLTTLSLCAWTAYHPNVYSHRSNWKVLSHRIMWMLIAVLVPEIVLWCAWEQWWAARKLQKEINDAGEGAFDGVGKGAGVEGECDICATLDEEDQLSEYNLDLLFEEPALSERSMTTRLSHTWKAALSSFYSKSKPTTPSKQETWTTQQSFFALSGGFAVPTSTFHPHPHLTLTPPALLFLANHGLLPRSTHTTVADKSKADTFAKILVCLQAGWFLIQCIARTAGELPMTLLEVHVLAHVLCAFAMYTVWAEKPYDVGAPLLCEDERVVELVALWALGVDSTSQRTTGDSLICIQRNVDTTPPLTLAQVQSAHQAAQSTSSSWFRYRHLLYNYLTSYHYTKPLKSNKRAPLPSKTPSDLEHTHLEKANAGLQYLRHRNTHVSYISKATHSYRHSSDNDQELDHHYIPDTSIRFPRRYVVPQRSNLIIEGLQKFDDDESRSSQFMLMMKTYSIVSAAYGGLHLIAWNSLFPSNIEKWFWRGSGIAMVSAPVVTLFSLAVWYMAEMLRVPEKRGFWGLRVFCSVVRRFCVAGAGVGLMLSLWCWVAYPVARVYVLAESFAALRACEKDVYRTVEWTKFIPHAG